MVRTGSTNFKHAFAQTLILYSDCMHISGSFPHNTALFWWCVYYSCINKD